MTILSSPPQSSTFVCTGERAPFSRILLSAFPFFLDPCTDVSLSDTEDQGDEEDPEDAARMGPEPR